MELCMRRLPARYNGLVMPLILTLIMTCIVSGVTTVRVAGIGPGFAANWLSAWVLSWLVAYPAILLALPVTRRLVGLVVEPPDRPGG
ncbi:MAG: DUF2798 domain-containing protein [Rhizobiales bacterium]|nr:DUF2798 domain-containing protein [Hyphomicrobiales bacterium]